MGIAMRRLVVLNVVGNWGTVWAISVILAEALIRGSLDAIRAPVSS
jgi:hypothetical protein